MHTLLNKILNSIDNADTLEEKVWYLLSYPNYSDEILAHIMKSDLYELPC